jgi:hypothetical protein
VCGFDPLLRHHPSLAKFVGELRVAGHLLDSRKPATILTMIALPSSMQPWFFRLWKAMMIIAMIGVIGSVFFEG